MSASVRMTKRLMIALALAAVLLATGCGEDDEQSASAPPASTETPAETTTPEAEPTREPTKPRVRKPKGNPPKRLVIEDLRQGSGPEATTGQTVQVHYVGVSFKTGEQFDASWDRDEPFAFQLGAGMVIPGWDQGVAGMKVGGRRRLVIPPELAYGPQGSPPAIGPNETLVFVVDLLAVQ
jgi:peptidylprolyl isomerase